MFFLIELQNVLLDWINFSWLMIEQFIGKLPNYQQVLSFIITSSCFFSVTFKRNLSWIFLPQPAHSWGPPILPQSSLTAIIIARAGDHGAPGDKWSVTTIVTPGACHVTLYCWDCLWFFISAVGINLQFPPSMHHVPDAVVCDQLMACKQSDNHWLYPNSELSDVENCPWDLLLLL